MQSTPFSFPKESQVFYSKSKHVYEYSYYLFPTGFKRQKSVQIYFQIFVDKVYRILNKILWLFYIYKRNLAARELNIHIRTRWLFLKGDCIYMTESSSLSMPRIQCSLLDSSIRIKARTKRKGGHWDWFTQSFSPNKWARVPDRIWHQPSINMNRVRWFIWSAREAGSQSGLASPTALKPVWK